MFRLQKDTSDSFMFLPRHSLSRCGNQADAGHWVAYLQDRDADESGFRIFLVSRSCRYGAPLVLWSGFARLCSACRCAFAAHQ